jgi:hypothetical protein
MAQDNRTDPRRKVQQHLVLIGQYKGALEEKKMRTKKPLLFSSFLTFPRVKQTSVNRPTPGDVWRTASLNRAVALGPSGGRGKQ